MTKVWRLAVIGLVACSAPEETGPHAGPIDGWDQLRDSVVVSILAPAHEQMINNAIMKTMDGTIIPISRFVYAIDVFVDPGCADCLRKTERFLYGVIQIGTVFRRGVAYLPAEGDPWSMEAAQALDCAYEDGRAREMYFALMGDVKEVPWDSLAASIDVFDRGAFHECMNGSPSPRIQAGIALAKELGIASAPAVVVDGSLVYPLSAESLDTAVDNTSARRREAVSREIGWGKK